MRAETSDPLQPNPAATVTKVRQEPADPAESIQQLRSDAAEKEGDPWADDAATGIVGF